MSEPQSDMAVFERLWGITNELRQKLNARFDLHLDSATANLSNYSDQKGEIQGSFNAYTGSEIDWLVHQWSHKPQSDFNYVRLVIWLGSQIRVPHLAFEFGTFGELLFYIDYIPRTDLSTDLEYLDRYYEPVNNTYLHLQKDIRFQAYNSRSTYIRQVFSPVCLCFTCGIGDETLTVVSSIAHSMIDRWLTWVDAAETVPESERADLSQRDLFLRRTIAERDPGNENAAQMFGEELTNKLVVALWGGDRR